MGSHKLYHIGREIARGAAEFSALLVIVGEVLLFWEIAAAIAHGTPVSAWCGAAVCVLAAALLIGAAYAVIRRVPRRARRTRHGVIDAETIRRILEESR